MKVTKKELFYEGISDRWENVINKKETEKRLKVVFEKLLKGVKLKNETFLEVGCGLGFFCQEAGRRGAEVVGIDVGEKLITVCKKKVPHGRFIVASGAGLPFSDESFDIVLCTEVLEHVDNAEKVLSEVYRVLKPKGYFVITTPNKLYKPLFDFLSLIKVRPYKANENWFKIRELKTILVSRGFSLKKEVYFNFLYPTRILDQFEKLSFLKYLMINQGYLTQKKNDK